MPISTCFTVLKIVYIQFHSVKSLSHFSSLIFYQVIKNTDIIPYLMRTNLPLRLALGSRLEGPTCHVHKIRGIYWIHWQSRSNSVEVDG
jgi:hypothetical protein